MIVYFLRGSLPWQALQASGSEELNQLVLEAKQRITVDELCQNLPSPFTAYFNYVRSLSGSKMPDYRYLRRQFRTLFRQRGFEFDYVFDWTILEFERLSRIQQDQVLRPSMLHRSNPGREPEGEKRFSKRRGNVRKTNRLRRRSPVLKEKVGK